jgi:CHAT domain-containing protein
MVLGPVGDVLAAAAGSEPLRVVVAPTGPLWSVPFAAVGIHPAGAALIDAAIVSTTSRPALATSRSPRAGGSPVVVGVQGGGVPAAKAEAERVAARLGPTCSLLIDDAATLDAIRRHRRPGVLHLASHGVHRQRSPLQSGVRLADGWLSAHRAAELDLDGSVVVLSACDTGASVVGDGEEVFGAQYGFLLAGAHNVVMSLWPAHDAMTADLMDDLHRSLASGTTAASALRTAQLAQRVRAPHPWWWSGFVVSGTM